jgi:hypothetical protein
MARHYVLLDSAACEYGQEAAAFHRFQGGQKTGFLQGFDEDGDGIQGPILRKSQTICAPNYGRQKLEFIVGVSWQNMYDGEPIMAH